MTTDDQTQLDRIEQKFDRIIEILNDLKNAREGRDVITHEQMLFDLERLKPL